MGTQEDDDPGDTPTCGSDSSLGETYSGTLSGKEELSESSKLMPISQEPSISEPRLPLPNP